VNDRFDLRIIWRKALTLLELSTKLRDGEPFAAEDRRAALALYPGLGSLRSPDLQWIVAQGKDTEKFPGTGTYNAITERLNAGIAGYFRGAIRSLSTAKTLDEELQVIGSRFFGFSDQGEQGQVDESPIEELQNIARKMNVPRDQFIRRFGQFLYTSNIESDNANDRGVELSTCHGAKGREWKAVILPSCNEGKFPDFRSLLDEQDLEAERRLFYVSMTRSSHRLYISYVDGAEGKTKPSEPSRFLYEAKLLKEPPPKPRQERLDRDSRYEPPVKRSSQAVRPGTSRQTDRPGNPGRKLNSASPARRDNVTRTGPAAPSGRPTSRIVQSSPGRKPMPISSSVTVTSPSAESLPPTMITVPGKLKRKMTFPRDGDIRRFIAELTDNPESLRLGDVVVEYEELEATFPLQLGLIVRGVPYQITEHHRLLESAHLAAVYRTLTDREPDYQRTHVTASADDTSPYKGLTVRTLVRVAREYGISSRGGTDILNDALEHAIRTDGDGDRTGIRFVHLAGKP